jgi:hypothetical protein
MLKRIVALLFLITCLSSSTLADGYFLVPDCQYETGSGTSFQCTDKQTYCLGLPSIDASVDYIVID